MSHCKNRKRYMKQFVQARHAFSAAHVMYIRSLRATGSALFQFAKAETTTLLNHHHLPPEPKPILPPPPPRAPTPMPPPPPPPMSPTPSSYTWTSGTASPALPPRPPPPPPVASSGWDFWDPFMQPPPPPSSRSATEEEWEATTTTGSEVVVMAAGAAASMAAPASSGVVRGFCKETPSSELAVVVSRNTKDLVEVIKELDDYFLKAADAGAHVSLLLQVPSSGFSDHSKTSKPHHACHKFWVGYFCEVLTHF